MKRILALPISLLLTLGIMLSLTSCGEPITLAKQDVNGVSISVPSDFGAFTTQDGYAEAIDEDSTGIIAISSVEDGQGTTIDSYDQETFQKLYCGDFKDVQFKKFDTKYEISGNPTLYTELTGVNPNGANVDMSFFMIFFDDGSVQTIGITYNVDSGCSVEENLQAMIQSIAIVE